ncbi:MAG: hypothetical protein ACI35S_09775 [Anaeroplasma sp.]
MIINKFDSKILASAHINFLFGAGVNGSAFPQINKFKKSIKLLQELLGEEVKNFEKGIDKLALLVFNKDNKDYDNVISEMNNLIENHPKKISKIMHEDNVWQYKFHSNVNETAFTITFIIANYYFN